MNTQKTFTEAVSLRRVSIEKRAVINSILDVIVEAIKYVDSTNDSYLFDELIGDLSCAESNIYAHISNYENRKKENTDECATQLP